MDRYGGTPRQRQEPPVAPSQRASVRPAWSRLWTVVIAVGIALVLSGLLYAATGLGASVG